MGNTGESSAPAAGGATGGITELPSGRLSSVHGITKELIETGFQKAQNRLKTESVLAPKPTSEISTPIVEGSTVTTAAGVASQDAAPRLTVADQIIIGSNDTANTLNSMSPHTENLSPEEIRRRELEKPLAEQLAKLNNVGDASATEDEGSKDAIAGPSGEQKTSGDFVDKTTGKESENPNNKANEAILYEEFKELIDKGGIRCAKIGDTLVLPCAVDNGEKGQIMIGFDPKAGAIQLSAGSKNIIERIIRNRVDLTTEEKAKIKKSIDEMNAGKSPEHQWQEGISDSRLNVWDGESPRLFLIESNPKPELIDMAIVKSVNYSDDLAQRETERANYQKQVSGVLKKF